MPLIPLFSELTEKLFRLLMLETVWSHIKDILILLYRLFLREIEPDRPLDFLGTVEYALLLQMRGATAML